MRRLLVLVLVVAAVAAAVYGVRELRTRFEKSPPELAWLDVPQVVGRNVSLALTARDGGAGLAWLRVSVSQRGVEKTVLEERYEEPRPGLETRVAFDARELGFRDGPIDVVARAGDAAQVNDGAGNESEATASPSLDTRPPSIEILSTHHNGMRGGAQMVAYRLRKAVTATGVVVGGVEFRAWPSLADPTVYVSLFSFPWDAQDLEPRIFAADALGNRGESRFYYQVKDRSFPDDRITVPPALIDKCRNDFPIPLDLDAKAAFLAVNDQRRKEDHAELARILASASVAEPLWQTDFLRLPNSAQRSRFAEQRTYLLDGEEIDRQSHLGVDLASNSAAAVPASATGRVLFTGDLGIYGNTVVLDHGFRLATLYAHLSSIAVDPGMQVERGTTIGHTGTTGLALGDHLHFGIYVGGLPVDPLEWWDPTWLRDRIDPKLQIWRDGGLPESEPAGAPS